MKEKSINRKEQDARKYGRKGSSRKKKVLESLLILHSAALCSMAQPITSASKI